MERIQSTIKLINEKGCLIINKVDKNQLKDFICSKFSYENSLSNNEIALLSEGTVVSFIPNITGESYFANDLKIVEQRLESEVKKILSNGNFFISKLDDKQEKDFLCLKANFDGCLENLKEGDMVSFIAHIDNHKFYANEVRLVSKKAENNTEKPDLNVKTLTNIFIETLESELSKIKKGSDFEDFTFFILKSLGISEIYAIPQNDASGRADGVFKVSSISTNGHRLEVIYDCTLRQADIWEKKKETQIRNYESQIVKSSMNINYHFGSTYSVKSVKQTISFNENADKQIWIITKGKTRLIEAKQSPDILIKEISIFDLIDLIKERYLDSTFVKVDEIADKLKNLAAKMH